MLVVNWAVCTPFPSSSTFTAPRYNALTSALASGLSVATRGAASATEAPRFPAPIPSASSMRSAAGNISATTAMTTVSARNMMCLLAWMSLPRGHRTGAAHSRGCSRSSSSAARGACASRSHGVAVRVADRDPDGVVCRLDPARDLRVASERDRPYEAVGARVDLRDGRAGDVRGPDRAGAEGEQRRLLAGHPDPLENSQRLGVDPHHRAGRGEHPHTAGSGGDSERPPPVPVLEALGLGVLRTGPDDGEPGGGIPGVVGTDPRVAQA